MSGGEEVERAGRERGGGRGGGSRAGRRLRLCLYVRLRASFSIPSLSVSLALPPALAMHSGTELYCESVFLPCFAALPLFLARDSGGPVLPSPLARIITHGFPHPHALWGTSLRDPRA